MRRDHSSRDRLNVEVYERTLGTMAGRGAGIVAQPQLLRLVRDVGVPELPTTSCLYRCHLLRDGDDVIRTERPLQFTSWYAIHRTLKSAFPADRYHSGSSLIGFDQAAGCVLARFADGGEHQGGPSGLRRWLALRDASQTRAGSPAELRRSTLDCRAGGLTFLQEHHPWRRTSIAVRCSHSAGSKR